MRRQLLIAVARIGTLVTLASASVAHAQTTCVYPFNWGPTPRTLDVWVNRGSGATIGISDDLLGAATSRAMSIWAEESGVPLKLNWRGLTPLSGNQYVTGAIMVNGATQNSASGSLSDTTTLAFGSSIQYSRIDVWNRIGDPVTGWHTLNWITDREPQDITTAFTDDLVSTLVHELGHGAYSLQHPDVDLNDDCAISPVPQSVMQSTIHNYGRVIKEWDMDKARYWYGDRASYSILKWSTFSDMAGTWGSALSLVASTIAYRFGSLSQAFAFTNLGWTQRNPSGTSQGQVRSSYYLTSGGTFNYQQTLADSTTLAGWPAPVAVATSPLYNQVLVAYRKRSTDPIYTNDNTVICYKTSVNSGQTFGGETCASSPTLSRYGLTVGYDPVTDVFMIAEARASGQMHIQVVPGASGATPAADVVLFTGQSWHAPSIACKGSGSVNCRIVWENKDANGCLTWSDAYVVPTTGYVAQYVTRTQCYTQYDTPSVAYYPVDDTYRLASGSGNYAAYSYKMAANGGTSWVGAGDIYNVPASLISTPVLATEYFCFFSCSGNLRSWFVKYF